jgi:hypothetical protein
MRRAYHAEYARLRKTSRARGALRERNSAANFSGKTSWQGSSSRPDTIQKNWQIRSIVAFAWDYRNTEALCLFEFARKGYIINAFAQPRRDKHGLPSV